jgi:dTDP-4-dehydrorhamnose reductase
MVKVLVTGASGQLGQAIKAVSADYKNIAFLFAGFKEADITNKKQIASIFTQFKPDFCINAAAYTAVDKAESEPDKAHAINAEGAKYVADACKEHDTVLIHISTDFVFDGLKKNPYTEEDIPNPKNVYGKTKREGEIHIQNILKKYFIIRTSWLYSQYGNNFMKTMLRLSEERKNLNVVNDQTGTPTNANDLADAILSIIKNGIKAYGIYHYSNEGEATWYDFAKKIFKVYQKNIDLHPIPTSSYPTPASRPPYSVLDKGKIKKCLMINIDDWKKSLYTLKNIE